MHKYNRSRFSKKSLLVVIVVLLVTAGILTGLELSGVTDFYQKDSDSSTDTAQQDVETINYSPPTEEEKKQADKVKEDIVKDQEAIQSDNPDQNSDKKSVKPIITSAGQFDGQIEVRSFIPGIYESSGTCTVVFTQNNNKIERQVEGIQDATTTRCDTVTILREDFPSSGTWTVKVNYSSPSSQGESDVTSFEVQ